MSGSQMSSTTVCPVCPVDCGPQLGRENNCLFCEGPVDCGPLLGRGYVRLIGGWLAGFFGPRRSRAHRSPWWNPCCIRPAMHPVWTALLVGHILGICFLLVPCQAGASPVSVRREVSPRAPSLTCGRNGSVRDSIYLDILPGKSIRTVCYSRFFQRGQIASG